jgi:UDP-glucose 4-epimerase
MKPTLAWVIGKGGLLGSHLARALAQGQPGTACWEGPPSAFCWLEPAVLTVQLARAVAAFAGAARLRYRSWLVAWAAGSGVIGSPPRTLEAETGAWRWLLELLGQHLLDGVAPLPGIMFLASSAGGVYGKGCEGVLSEAVPPCPASEYGLQKLSQEGILHEWACRWDDVGYVIGRIANLYGPGQNLAKPQGLISHLARCLIYQRPVSLYVPLDTMRDYVYAADSAELIVRCLERAREPGPGCRVVRLIASEEGTSVARVVGVFTRLSRRPLRITCAPSPLAAQQARKLLFRSEVWPDLRLRRPMPLVLGIRSVYQHQLALFHQGLLPPPVAA